MGDYKCSYCSSRGNAYWSCYNNKNVVNQSTAKPEQPAVPPVAYAKAEPAAVPPVTYAKPDQPAVPPVTYAKPEPAAVPPEICAKPEQHANPATVYNTASITDDPIQRNDDEICMHIAAPGAVTISGPVYKGEEYQLAVLNLDMPQCGKRITELSFACNLDVRNTPLDINIQLLKMWDNRHIWIPLTAPFRIVKQNVTEIANSIGFHVYDMEQIRSQCFSYLVLLRFLRPIAEKGRITVNSALSAMTQKILS